MWCGRLARCREGIPPLRSGQALPAHLAEDSWPGAKRSRDSERRPHHIDACFAFPSTCARMTNGADSGPGFRRDARSSIGNKKANPLSEGTNRRPRILSGMRPTGKLHLGNLVGALQNWVKLQDEYESYHFVADWHMLTTDYENTLEPAPGHLGDGGGLAGLRAGSPQGHFFHAVPSAGTCRTAPALFDGDAAQLAGARADVQRATREHQGPRPPHLRLSGLPAAASGGHSDVQGRRVPVGEDQVPHVEFTREVARRFNLAYGELEMPTSAQGRSGFRWQRPAEHPAACRGPERSNLRRPSASARWTERRIS